MFLKYNQFIRGICEDGDPTNDGASPLVELVNLDIIRSDDPTAEGYDTMLRVRPAFDFYTDGGLDNALLPSPTGGRTWYKAYQWQSGVKTVQTNFLLVFRKARGSIWDYEFHTNAPALSAGAGINTWWMAETDVYAPEITVVMESGRLRITLGNTDQGMSGSRTNDYRILVDLVPGEGQTRTYFTTGATVTRATVTGRANILPFGAGGVIERGWLWDYGYPYDPFKLPGASGAQIGLAIQEVSTSTIFLDADWSVIVAQVLDDDPEQIGAQYVANFKKDINLSPIAVFAGMITGAAFSPRTTALAIYVRRTNHSSGDMNDALRVATVPVSTLSATWPGSPTLFQIILLVDNDTLISGSTNIYGGGTPQGAWAPDTQNRQIYPTGTGTGQTTTTQNVETFHVKPKGLTMRKETMFAWGTGGNQAQALIRPSAINGSRGMYDVFPDSEGVWKGGVSLGINLLAEWDDRIVQFHDTAIYHMEPQDDIRARDSYLHGADSFGYGMPMDFVQSFVKGKTALYFANDYGIYAFRTGRVENLLDGKRFKRWNFVLTPEARRTCIAGFYPLDEELWLAFQTDPADPSSWVIWVYRDDGTGISQWRDYKIAPEVPNGSEANYVPAVFKGFVCDVEKGWFIPYGTFVSQHNAQRNVFMQFNADNAATDEDFSTPIANIAALDARSIAWSVAPKFQGNRHQDIVVESVDVQTSATETLTLELYANDHTTAYHTRSLTQGRDYVHSLKPRRCYNFRWRLSGSYAGATARSEIRQLAFSVSAARKRRK